MRKHISIPLEKLQIDMFSLDITCQHCKNQITFEQGRILFYITSRPEILQEGQFLSYHEAVMNKMVIQIQINTIYNRIQQTQQTIPYLFCRESFSENSICCKKMPTSHFQIPD